MEELKIRKLTPKECFRLQDFDDEDFEKAEAVNSNTQLYKQAGNSITVACPYYIFKALIDANILIEKENKEMELKMNEYQLPEVIQFNYEELKNELTSKVSMYETMVYTDDQIKSAKADKANLNKLKKALNDERIRREKEYMIPFNDFKTKINEIISIIDKPVAVIDKQVKEFEEQQKQEKLQSIKELWEGIENKPEGLALEEIFDSKWLNASTSMKSIQDAIDYAIDKFKTDLATIKLLPEFSFEAEQIYISTLDINKAINEAHRMSEMAKKKAEFEATQAAKLAEQVADAEFSKAMNPPVEEVAVSKMETVEPAKQWISFSANLTIDQARELKKFFDDRAIEFKSI